MTVPAEGHNKKKNTCDDGITMCSIISVVEGSEFLRTKLLQFHQSWQIYQLTPIELCSGSIVLLTRH